MKQTNTVGDYTDAEKKSHRTIIIYSLNYICSFSTVSHRIFQSFVLAWLNVFLSKRPDMIFTVDRVFICVLVPIFSTWHLRTLSNTTWLVIHVQDLVHRLTCSACCYDCMTFLCPRSLTPADPISGLCVLIIEPRHDNYSFSQQKV